MAQQQFTTFQAWLETPIPNTHMGWQVEIPDGRFLEIAKALQEIPAEDLTMPGFWQYEDHSGYTIFLDGYKPNDPARPSAWKYSKYYYVCSRFYREEIEQERRHQAEVDAAPGQYYICTFGQNPITNEILLQSIALTSYTDKAKANAVAASDERKMQRIGEFGVTIVARKAATREDAQRGVFLDD